MSDAVAVALRQRSYVDYFGTNNLREGPTRWVLAKYPFVCSKCGKKPCVCLLTPWVLEDRREEPDEYLAKFWNEANNERRKLGSLDHEEFTVKSLIDHFATIYRANYYHQDLWQIGMHLSEEMGEATVELGRIELRRRAEEENFDIAVKADEILTITKDDVWKRTEKITERDAREKFRSKAQTRLEDFERDLKGNAWTFFGDIVAEKFKEEIADVLSWIVAIVVKIDRNYEIFGKFPDRFSQKGMGNVLHLGCPWCHAAQCSDDCLIKHDVSKELTEKIMKF